MTAVQHISSHDHLRRASQNPMSISSLLNDHDHHHRSEANALDALLGLGQRPLPSNNLLDTAAMYPSVPQHLAYRPYGGSMSAADTSMSRRGSAARAPRPKYSDDQGYFIWYHRTDLAEPWDRVLQEFAKQFNHRRPKGGLQCKFYRLLGDWGVEKVREQARQSQSRSRDRVGQYGLVQRTTLRYDWMQPEHINAPALPQFASTHPRSPGGSPCPGCDDCHAKMHEAAALARM